MVTPPPPLSLFPVRSFDRYPTLLSVILSVFDCVTLASVSPSGDVSLLRTDMTVNCDSDLYRVYRGWAFIFALLYIIGIPLLAWAALFRRRHVLRASLEDTHVDTIVHLNATVLISLHTTLGVPLDAQDRRDLDVVDADAVEDWGAAPPSVPAPAASPASSPSASPSNAPRRALSQRNSFSRRRQSVATAIRAVKQTVTEYRAVRWLKPAIWPCACVRVF